MGVGQVWLSPSHETSRLVDDSNTTVWRGHEPLATCGARKVWRGSRSSEVARQVEPGHNLHARVARVLTRSRGTGGGQSFAGKQPERRPGTRDRMGARGRTSLALDPFGIGTRQQVPGVGAEPSARSQRDVVAAVSYDASVAPLSPGLR